MKKLLTFIILVLFISTSCSKDDNKGGQQGYVTFKIDGVSKTYQTITVLKNTYTDDTPPTNRFDIQATDGVNITNSVSFTYTPNREIYLFDITNEGNRYSYSNNTFNTQVIESSDTHIKGYFAGTLESSDRDLEGNRIVADIEAGEFLINL